MEQHFGTYDVVVVLTARQKKKSMGYRQDLNFPKRLKQEVRQ
jgi:hypothetical protein